MSILELTTLSPQETILHYVMECRNDETTLPYTDLELIECWLEAIEKDGDALLLILSDILPEYFAKKKRARSLRGLKLKVLKKIREYKNHNSSVVSY
ncbi:MAG: hypothetical protein HYW48_11175 [Deltaproteobacteria bacterium]|nr:hypothetical protein [Deltaproteobacteria bacterium]